MKTRKRSRPQTEGASKLSSADDDSSTTSLRNSDLAVANKRARNSAPIDKIPNVVELCKQVFSHVSLYGLLHAMQAGLTFKTNIDNSHRLQLDLFLAPDPKRHKLTISTSGTLLPRIKAAQHIAAAEAGGQQTIGEVTCCTLHPDLQLDPESHRLLCFARTRKGMVQYAA